MWSSNLITGKDACVLWYQEGKDYNYAIEPKILKCGKLVLTNNFVFELHNCIFTDPKKRHYSYNNDLL